MTYIGQFTDDPYYMTAEEEEAAIRKDKEEQQDKRAACIHEWESRCIRTRDGDIINDWLECPKCGAQR